MNKLLLTLGVLAALSAPAAAGRLDVDLSRTDDATQQADVNVTASKAIDAGQINSDTDPFGHGTLFGANSR
jgi:ribonuclease PH